MARRGKPPLFIPAGETRESTKRKLAFLHREAAGPREYVSLIVKGSKKHAKREAARQGVPVASCVEKGAETQCFVKCTPTTSDRLARWFVADRGKRGSRSRRPPGTLLYHSSAVKCDRGR